MNGDYIGHTIEAAKKKKLKQFAFNESNTIVHIWKWNEAYRTV